MFFFQARHLMAAALAVGIAQTAFAASVQTSTIYNTLGGAENGGDSFSSGGRVLLDEVFTGAAASTLFSVDLTVKLKKADLGSFDVVITQIGANGVPRLTQLINTVSDQTVTTDFGLITVKPTTTIPLAANTHYYVGIQRHSGGGKCSIVLGNTVDPAVLSRQEVAGGYYYNNGGAQPNSGGPYEMRVKTKPAA